VGHFRSERFRCYCLRPCLVHLQGKSVQQPVWRFELPDWMQVEDERGEKVTQGDLAPTGAGPGKEG